MKTIRTLLIVAVAAAGWATTTEAQAQHIARGAVGGHSQGLPAAHGGGIYRGGAGGYHSGYWHGGDRGYWRGGHVGIYVGVPLGWSVWGWPYYGYPYYGYPYYPYEPYYSPPVYRYTEPYPEYMIESAPTTAIPPRTEDTPSQEPLYLNYCESAGAYYPKVTKCPEGWRLARPAS